MSSIKLFENKQVRSQWDDERQTWLFSIVDIVGVPTDSPNPRTYWSVFKTRLKKEGSELATNCSQLKMRSADGKQYLTDVADTEQLLRLVQSVPSSKAEPFKQWLARVGYERIEETEDPELAFDRAMETYLKKDYTKEWSGLSTRQFRQRKEQRKKSYPLVLRQAVKSPSKAAPLPVTPEKPLKPSQTNPSSALVTQSS